MDIVIIIIGICVLAAMLMSASRPRTSEIPGIYVVPSEPTHNGGCFPGLMMFVLGVIVTLWLLGQLVMQ